MLSIKVALVWVMRVGFVIVGIKFLPKIYLLGQMYICPYLLLISQTFGLYQTYIQFKFLYLIDNFHITLHR